MQARTIGAIYEQARLIAKSLNRLVVEPDSVDLTYWKYEGKLLCSEMGDCMSSTTLLVRGCHVATYGDNGRCYGILLDAEKCYIFDVNYGDANTNRTDKTQKRQERRGIDLYHANTQGLVTLDALSGSIKLKGKGYGVLNEVLLDAPKEACIGLYVRKLDLQKADSQGLKHYYQSLLEIKLIQKYFIEVFHFPKDLKVYQYSETEGRLFSFPNNWDELVTFAKGAGVTDKTLPRLFYMLSDAFHFPPLPKPLTVEQYLRQWEPAFSEAQLKAIYERLSKAFETFNGNKFDPEKIKEQIVDETIGVSETEIKEVISSLENYKGAIPESKDAKKQQEGAEPEHKDAKQEQGGAEPEQRGAQPEQQNAEFGPKQIEKPAEKEPRKGISSGKA